MQVGLLDSIHSLDQSSVKDVSAQRLGTRSDLSFSKVHTPVRIAPLARVCWRARRVEPRTGQHRRGASLRPKIGQPRKPDSGWMVTEATASTRVVWKISTRTSPALHMRPRTSPAAVPKDQLRFFPVRALPLLATLAYSAALPTNPDRVHVRAPILDVITRRHSTSLLFAHAASDGDVVTGDE